MLIPEPNPQPGPYLSTTGQLPRLVLPDGRKVARPCIEWTLYQLRWRFLMDSYEGGEAYRMAVYGYDLRGMPVRNLIRHKREYPSDFDRAQWSMLTGRPDGTDPANQATDDDYEQRRARTPIPQFTREAIEAHQSKIYNREVSRLNDQNPPELVEWWKDVDGTGTTIDQWAKEIMAPFLMTLGQLDLLFDHPKAPAGVEIRNQADVLKYGLDRCVVSHILPENIPWWRLNPDGSYRECVVREVCDDGGVRWRYWNAEGWCLFDAKGNPIPDLPDESADGSSDDAPPPPQGQAVLTPHPFGLVPIVRLFDRRRPRHRHVGLPRYEAIAEIQREYYNRDSELVLSDTTQAHPILQGPEDFVQPDGTVPVGPNWLLPEKKITGSGQVTYHGFSYVDPPKGAADSLRTNKTDLRDAADRAAGLTKPAGAHGTGKGTVAQSGVSKRIDQQHGNELLGAIAEVLERAEIKIARMALAVLHDGNVPTGLEDKIAIRYPRDFDLFSVEELAMAVIQLQQIIAQAGESPEVEGELIQRLVRLMLPGLPDEEYGEFDEEIEALMEAKAERLKQQQEAAPTMLGSSVPDGGVGGGEDVTNPMNPPKVPPGMLGVSAGAGEGL